MCQKLWFVQLLCQRTEEMSWGRALQVHGSLRLRLRQQRRLLPVRGGIFSQIFSWSLHLHPPGYVCFFMWLSKILFYWVLRLSIPASPPASLFWSLLLNHVTVLYKQCAWVFSLLIRCPRILSPAPQHAFSSSYHSISWYFSDTQLISQYLTLLTCLCANIYIHSEM